MEEKCIVLCLNGNWFDLHIDLTLKNFPDLYTFFSTYSFHPF